MRLVQGPTLSISNPSTCMGPGLWVLSIGKMGPRWNAHNKANNALRSFSVLMSSGEMWWGQVVLMDGHCTHSSFSCQVVKCGGGRVVLMDGHCTHSFELECQKAEGLFQLTKLGSQQLVDGPWHVLFSECKRSCPQEASYWHTPRCCQEDAPVQSEPMLVIYTAFVHNIV